MFIEALSHNDIHLLSGLQPEGWNDILPNFDYYTKSSFCFPIKVVIDDNVVGIGATVIHHDIAWLGHIIVHPKSRGNGLGRLIMETLVDTAKQRECETIYLIATDLGAPVYEKAGFETETEYLFFKDISIEKKLPASKNIEPYRQEFQKYISTIDKMTSGEDRMFHFEDHLPSGFVYREDGVIGGFYLPTFGEGLIIANTGSAGLGLLKLHLLSSDKLVLPKDNSIAKAFLYKNGYKEYRIAKRMRLGKKRTVNLANIYSRIGGNLG